MPKQHYTRITEKDWKIVRTLRENGMSARQVMDITGRAAGTQASIMKSKNFEDYQQIASANSRRWNKEYKPGGKYAPPLPIAGIDYDTTDATPELPTPTQVWQFGDENNHLERIAVALERMADAWEKKPDGEPSKRGIFGR